MTINNDDFFDSMIKQRTTQLTEWLANNISCYPTPITVTLFAFKVNWQTLSGTFRLQLDNQEIQSEDEDEKFTFSLEQNGKVQFDLPRFCSPLGVPASYAAIELTEATSKAILKGLHTTIPCVLAFGRDKTTGKQVWSDTALKERIIDKAAFKLAKTTVSEADYSVTINTDNLQLTFNKG